MRGIFGMNRRGQNGQGNAELPGIVIRRAAGTTPPPRIQAFVWGGKLRQTPTLPYGRWKEIA